MQPSASENTAQSACAPPAAEQSAADRADECPATAPATCRTNTARTQPVSGLWTLLPVAAGLAVVTCCVLIPQIDRNRELLFQQRALQQHLEYLDQQIGINEEFLKRVGEDPVLTERLAQRYLKLVREDCAILRLEEQRGAGDMSPFALVNVPPPPPAPSYEPISFPLAEHVRDPRKRLWLLCGGLMLVGAGIVLGFGARFHSATTLRAAGAD